MRRVKHWVGGTLFLGLLAAGIGGCGGSSSNGDESSDGDGGSSSGSGGTDGGTTDGNNANTGDETASSSGNGNTTSGIVQGDPVSLEDYAAEVGAIVCGWLTPCCVGLGLPLTQMDCEGTLGASLGLEYASADPNNYTYDPDLAGDCLATARGFYDQFGCEVPSGDIDAGAVEVCNTVFQGKLEPGTACTADIECAVAPGEDAECDELDFETDATVCIVDYRAAEGDSCYWSCSEESGATSCFGVGAGETPAVQGKCYTNDQLYCADGVCQRQPALGEACTGDATCAEGYCSTAGECSTADNEGATCAVDTECSEGLYCETQVCTPQKPIGEMCTFSEECQSNNCSEDECAEASDAGLGIALACVFASGQLE